MSKRQEPIADLPGWYEHPHMYESLCFWDGEDWTDQVAPKPQTLQADFWVGVRIVALGTAAATMFLVILFGLGGAL